MKKSYTYLCILLLWASSASAQLKERLPSHLDLHVMPLALAHPDPSFRLGGEFMTKSRWSFGASIGFGYSRILHLMAPKDRRSDYRMLELRPEVKYYFFEQKDMGWYFAIEGVNLRRSNSSKNSSYYISSSEKIGFEKAEFEKTKRGGIAKIGVKFLIGPKLSMDLFSGLGLSRTFVRYSDVEHPEVQAYDPFFESENFFPGMRTTGLFAAGIKIGFRPWQEN